LLISWQDTELAMREAWTAAENAVYSGAKDAPRLAARYAAKAATNANALDIIEAARNAADAAVKSAAEPDAIAWAARAICMTAITKSANAGAEAAWQRRRFNALVLPALTGEPAKKGHRR
jgi:hypothetical protein